MKRLSTLVFLGACALHGGAPGAIAIRDARIAPVSGPVIPRGTVVLRGGLIEAVGSAVAIPADAWVIEGEGLTVYPGLMDALSTLGAPELAPVVAPRPTAGQAATTPAPAVTPAVTPAVAPARGPEDRPSTTSWMKAADMVKTNDARIEAARAAGITTSATFPQRGIFAGQGSAIDLAGARPGDMVVADNIGQYVSLATGGFGSGYPASLMGAIAYVRQVYLDAEYYRRAKEFYAGRPRGTARPEYDRALEGVLASPRVLLPAQRAIDIQRMIAFAHEMKLKPVLYGVPEGYLAVDALKKSGVPVLVNLKWPEKPAESDPEEADPLRVLELRELAPSTPAALAKNGVRFAFYAEGIEKRADLCKAVKRALDAGLSREDAVRAMTLSPAEIFGLADRLGSIEAGKIANLVVTKGDLFEEKTEVKYVFVDGNKFEPAVEPQGARP